MFYEYAITTPPNTYLPNEKKTICRLTPGILEYVQIVFPSGCAGLTGIRILDGGHQIIPENIFAHIVTDNEVVKIPLEREIISADSSIIVYTYNEDDTYQHTLRVRCNVKVKEKPTLILPTETIRL